MGCSAGRKGHTRPFWRKTHHHNRYPRPCLQGRHRRHPRESGARHCKAPQKRRPQYHRLRTQQGRENRGRLPQHASGRRARTVRLCRYNHRTQTI